MRKILVGLGLSAFLFGGMMVSPVALGAHHQSVKQTQKKSKSVLFVMSAKKGVFGKDKFGPTLTLSGVNPKVLWFTDRPNRQSGSLPTKKVIQNWNKMFKTSQPNSAMVHADMKADVNGVTQAEAFETINPRLNKSDSVTFRVKQIQGDHLVTQNVKNVSLFIDNLPWRDVMSSSGFVID